MMPVQARIRARTEIRVDRHIDAPERATQQLESMRLAFKGKRHGRT
jgi:hypothetical protein